MIRTVIYVPSPTLDDMDYEDDFNMTTNHFWWDPWHRGPGGWRGRRWRRRRRRHPRWWGPWDGRDWDDGWDRW